MQRSSTIRNAAQITNIAALMKQADISCVKCLDTKKVWSQRNRNNDGRGRIQIQECPDCGRGEIMMLSHSIPEKENGKTIYEMFNNNIQERMNDLAVIIKEKEIEQEKWKKNELLLRRKETLKGGSIDAELNEQIEMNSTEPAWRRHTEVVFDFPFETSKDEMINQIVEKEELRVSIDGFNMKDHLISQFEISPHQSVTQIGDNVYILFKNQDVTNRANAPWFVCGCTWSKTMTVHSVTVAVMQPKNVAAFNVCNVQRQKLSRQMTSIVPLTVERVLIEKEKKEKEEKEKENKDEKKDEKKDENKDEKKDENKEVKLEEVEMKEMKEVKEEKKEVKDK